MAERSWSVLDKSSWGEGPWLREPDKVQWVDPATGLDCLIVRNDRFGNLCGYVGVAPGHPWHGRRDVLDCLAPRFADDLIVHGGVGYVAFCQESEDELAICHVPEPGRPADVFWFGFACAQFLDALPGLEARERAYGWNAIRAPGESYKTIDYVRGEVTRLAYQLAEVGARS